MVWTEKFRPGKFEGNNSQILAEYLYTISMEQGCDENYGFVDEGGWYGLLGQIDKPNTEAYLRQEYQIEPEVHWYYILNEDSQGFFTYYGYDTPEEVRKAWEHVTSAS